jgi:transposase-like protein
VFKTYTAGFKARMIQRMSGPGATSANSLSEEVGVPQSTLSRWLRDAGTVPPMDGTRDDKRSDSKRPQDWTPEEKLRVVSEAMGLEGNDLGEFLRKKGLHRAQLDTWRTAAEQALSSAKSPRKSKPSSEDKRIRELERDLRHKEKALAEMAALLVLKKKLEALWGDEDESTAAKNER